jgi:hypothetical protein
MLQGHWGHEMSAPAKVAQVILQLASKEQLPAHLLLGSDAVQYARFAEEKRDSDAKAWHNISVSTDAEDVKGLPDLKFLNWCWRGCGDPWHASILSIDVTQFPYGGQLSTEGAPGLPNRLKSAAVRRRLIIFSIGICCHKVAWITSG